MTRHSPTMPPLTASEPSGAWECTTMQERAADTQERRPVGRQGAGPYECPKCGEVRILKTKPRTTMCGKCAGLIGSRAAAALKRDIIERLWEKRTITPEDCWNWGGTKQRSGYGAIFYEGKTLRTHRVSYEVFVAPIPEGLHIDHLCRNKACFNPAHLEPVTHVENMRRTRRDQCVNGHALTDENVYVYQNKRLCRSCRRDRNRNAWRAKHGKK